MHTGHVVYRVTHQNLIVQHQAGRHAKFFLHTGQIAAFAIHGVDDGDVLVDQLRQVFVATGHNHFNAMRRTHCGQGADHIVGFNAGYIQYFPTHQTHQFVNGLNLRTQIVWHGAAILFVLGVDVVAEGGALGIKHTDRILGGDVFAQALHHVDHAADSACGGAGGVAWHRTQIGHGMEGTVEIAGAIHQQQGFLVAHTPIVPVQTAFCACGIEQKCHQHPLQSSHEFRRASAHPPQTPKHPLNHGCFHARFRGACSIPPD